MIKYTIFLLLLSSISINSNGQASLNELKDNAYNQRHDSKDAYVQRIGHYSFKDKWANISLKEALEGGLSKGHEYRLLNLSSEAYNLSKKSVEASFWHPQLNLSFSTFSTSMLNLRGKKGFGSPGGSLGIEFDDYTLFNWGKDYMKMKNETDGYDRRIEENRENIIALKLNIFETYLDLIHAKVSEKYYKEFLRNASFIYRTNKQRVVLKKIKKQEYYQARALYLEAQRRYHDAKVAAAVIDDSLSYYMNANKGTRYQINEEVGFNPIQTKYSEALKYAKKSAPLIRRALSNMKIATRSYKLAQKENYPLPEFSLFLGAYRYTFNNSGNNSDYYNSYGSNEIGDVEVVAKINAVWNLWGGDGFLSQRKIAQARVAREIGRKTFLQAGDLLSTRLRESYRKIYHYEDYLKILKPQVSNNDKLYDITLDNYLKKKASFEDLKESLKDLLASRINLHLTKVNHLKEKILVARYIGADNLPGDSFESVIKKKGKTK